jgi:hypothetical protein
MVLYIGFGAVIFILWWIASWLGRKFDELSQRLDQIENQHGKEK